MTKTTHEIVDAAKLAAKEAAENFIKVRGEPFYCGFAWIEVKVDRTNSKIAKELIAEGFKVDYKPKILVLWNPSGINTQSIDVKAAGVRAAVKILRDAGFNATEHERLD